MVEQSFWSESILGSPTSHLPPPIRRGVSCVEPLVRYSDSRPDSFACSPPLLSGSRTTLAVGGDGHRHVPNRMREIAATRAQSAVLLSGGKVDLLSAVRDIQEKFKGRVQFFIFCFVYIIHELVLCIACSGQRSSRLWPPGPSLTHVIGCPTTFTLARVSYHIYPCQGALTLLPMLGYPTTSTMRGCPTAFIHARVSYHIYPC